MPLSALAPSPQTEGVSGPFWRDRKLFFWARAADDDGGIAEVVMSYFYPMQPGLFFREAIRQQWQRTFPCANEEP